MHYSSMLLFFIFILIYLFMNKYIIVDIKNEVY